MAINSLGPLIFRIAFMLFLGYILRKKDIINDDFQKRMSTILLNVVIPCSILSVGNSPYQPQMASGLLWAAAFTLAFYLLASILLLLVRRPLPIGQNQKNMFFAMALLGNTGYIGFPVIYELYGSEGILYAVMCNLGFQLACFTVGVRVLGGRLTVKQFFANPLTIIPMLAIALFLSPLRFPVFVLGALDQIAALSAPFSMFITGAALAQIPFASLYKDKWAWFTNAFKMLLFPLGMALVLWQLGFSGILPCTLVVVSSLPPGTINVIFAEKYASDIPFTTRGVVLGTVLMLAVLPLWALFSAYLFL